MPRVWHEEYSEGEDYDMEYKLKEKYSCKGMSPRDRCRRRIKEIWCDSDSEDDGCYRSRPRRGRRLAPPAAPVTELVVKPKPPTDCKYKCCPCHKEKAEAAAKAACLCAAAAAAKPPEKKPEEPRILIEVDDRSGGPMAQKHGSSFNISIAPKATVEDILTMLTPDRTRVKVVVHWDDGYCGDLESVAKVDDIIYYAKKLVICKRKQVRWGGSGRLSRC